MRDGKYIDTLHTASCEMQQLIGKMVGRVIYEEPKTASCVPKDAQVVLEARNLVSPQIKNVSFQLRRGEILGFAGLMGAGRNGACKTGVRRGLETERHNFEKR